MAFIFANFFCQSQGEVLVKLFFCVMT